MNLAMQATTPNLLGSVWLSWPMHPIAATLAAPWKGFTSYRRPLTRPVAQFA